MAAPDIDLDKSVIASGNYLTWAIGDILHFKSGLYVNRSFEIGEYVANSSGGTPSSAMMIREIHQVQDQVTELKPGKEGDTLKILNGVPTWVA